MKFNPKPPRILCLDDNAQLLSVLKICLEKAGFEVLTALEGTDALALYRLHAGNFSAVVTDNEMPTMGGAEFSRRLRKLGFTGRIVVMSGNLKAEELTSFQEAMVGGFFNKPFNVDLLVSMLLKDREAN